MEQCESFIARPAKVGRARQTKSGHFPCNFSFCIRSKPDRSHGSQGMVGSPHTVRVVKGCARTTSTCRSMATTSAMECLVDLSRGVAQCCRDQEESASEAQQLDIAMASMARFREEMARTASGPPIAADPTPTQPGRIPELVAELDRLRARVAEMEIERDERKKRSRSRSVHAAGLVDGPDVSLQEWGALHDQHVGQFQGANMETLMSRGSTPMQSNRFSPLV